MTRRLSSHSRRAAVVAVVFAFALAVALTACSSDSPAAAGATVTTPPDRLAGPLPSTPPEINVPTQLLPDGVLLQTITNATGPLAQTGDHVTIEYTTWVQGGGPIESSYQEGKGPYTFAVGSDAVIPGWDHAMLNMHVGGQYRLTVPPDLAYGTAGNALVPPNTTIITDIQLVADSDRTPTPKG
ncbi:MAG: FKBP-type peptidyl-prolyl cis-trans isomerase [Chloroflexota bacterium]